MKFRALETTVALLLVVILIIAIIVVPKGSFIQKNKVDNTDNTVSITDTVKDNPTNEHDAPFLGEVVIESKTFTATIIEETTEYMVVEPVKDSAEYNLSDRISIVHKHDNLYGTGKSIEITYNIIDQKPYIQITTDRITLLETNDIPEEAADEWGISLYVENVTPEGATLVFNQNGGKPTGDLQYGDDFVIEKYNNEEWIAMEYIIDNAAFNSIAYTIPFNEESPIDTKWNWLYGELTTGKYRIGKTVMDFRKTADYDEKMYYAEFEIK